MPNDQQASAQEALARRILMRDTRRIMDKPGNPDAEVARRAHLSLRKQSTHKRHSRDKLTAAAGIVSFKSGGNGSLRELNARRAVLDRIVETIAKSPDLQVLQSHKALNAYQTEKEIFKLQTKNLERLDAAKRTRSAASLTSPGTDQGRAGGDSPKRAGSPARQQPASPAPSL
ncbi:hypothetical protein [Phytohabitans suffuscus]|uniref:Uncharacterized protein n=1 Tax=Phytohabitans suffuscus TaxID=624315 RepID=A0A6F8YTY1_9ACTN|nr:hypothetical protein [Phytohabitans suffuscus]BCB89398.1 hypothetical protein Psuf_067110 [Phytohabitans suffuscus]